MTSALLLVNIVKTTPIFLKLEYKIGIQKVKIAHLFLIKEFLEYVIVVSSSVFFCIEKLILI